MARERERVARLEAQAAEAARERELKAQLEELERAEVAEAAEAAAAVTAAVRTELVARAHQAHGVDFDTLTLSEKVQFIKVQDGFGDWAAFMVGLVNG